VALAALLVPPVALSQHDQGAGSPVTQSASSQEQAAATPNFSIEANGTATSCGAGCTEVSGAYHGTLSGTFTGEITVDNSSSGCAAARGVITLYNGSDSVLQSVAGTLCGASFFGDYDVPDGTGAYQENGAGWGSFHAMFSYGAFSMSSDGTFYPHMARQTGVGYGH